MSVSVSAGEMVSVQSADNTDSYKSVSPELKNACERKRKSKPFVFCQHVMCQTAEREMRKGRGQTEEKERSESFVLSSGS